MALTASVCGVVDALSDFQNKVIALINGKFAALRRLADLLEQLGDLNGFLPDISRLVPISSIDLYVYESLRAECPFLGLPPASGDPEQSLGALRAQVNTAYGRLLAQLNLNPYGRLSKLQQKLDDYQQKFNLSALNGVDFMQCLQAACQAAVAVEGAVSNLSNMSANDVRRSAETYLKNMVTDQGRILRSAAQAKVDSWQSTRNGVQELMDVPVVDLPDISSAWTSSK